MSLVPLIVQDLLIFLHGETQWNPPTENLISYGKEGRPSFNINNVQSRMDMSLGWVNTASSKIIRDVNL